MPGRPQRRGVRNDHDAAPTETTDLTPEQVLQRDWATNPRWAGIERSYTSADVNLERSVEEQTLAKNERRACGGCCTTRPTSALGR